MMVSTRTSFPARSTTGGTLASLLVRCFGVVVVSLRVGEVGGFVATTATHPFAATTPRGTNDERSVRVEDVRRASTSGIPSSASAAAVAVHDDGRRYDHVLAVLVLPKTAADRVGNEAVLAKAVSVTAPSRTLSVALRRRDDDDRHHSLAALRRYVGEVYSAAWDAAAEQEQQEQPLLDLVVYPQNLPNAPPESWLHHRPDLGCVCGRDSTLGWHSDMSVGGTGRDHEDVDGDGAGGLEAHVRSVNEDRAARGLDPVDACRVDEWLPDVVAREGGSVVFLEDDDHDHDDDELSSSSSSSSSFQNSSLLFERVSVGGTFDGLHYGHRKLLTLAVSSVNPGTGRLLVGVTSDAMLTQKTLSHLIPPAEERIAAVRDFLGRLAPGLKNALRVVELHDAWGPPAREPDFDALVLSDEVLETGLRMNEFRRKNGHREMTLLCTRRTESNAMSSTTLRRWRQRRLLTMEENDDDDEQEEPKKNGESKEQSE